MISWIYRHFKILLEFCLPPYRSGSEISAESPNLRISEGKGFHLNYCEEEPIQLEMNCIYLVGEKGDEWQASFLCPCDCGVIIKLNILQHPERPTWTVWMDSNSQVNITPSVWRKVGCLSHFSLKQGRILWHKDENLTEEELGRFNL